MVKLKVIDLFAGCGGLMDGFEQCGKYDTIAAVEWEKAPCANLIKRMKTKWNYNDANERVLYLIFKEQMNYLEGGIMTLYMGNRKDWIS